MIIESQNLSPEEAYRLLCGIVVPRPIAWITTLSEAGVVNLAPFSCFTFVSSKPPMLGVNIGRKAGARKDTAVNMLALREFVVNIGNRSHITQIHDSSAELPPEVSEADELGLATAASQTVRVPRLADAPVSMECRLTQVIPFGDTGAEFYVGEVTRFHLRDGLRQNNRIDTLELDPVCRIGGPNYATLGEIISMRPVAQTPKAELRESDA